MQAQWLYLYLYSLRIDIARYNSNRKMRKYILNESYLIDLERRE